MTASVRAFLSKAARKQLKSVASLKITLIVELKLGQAKKPAKYSGLLLFYRP